MSGHRPWSEVKRELGVPDGPSPGAERLRRLEDLRKLTLVILGKALASRDDRAEAIVRALEDVDAETRTALRTYLEERDGQ